MDLYLKHSLCIDVADAIETSIQGLTSHQEPDFVASLVTILPQKLSVVLPSIYIRCEIQYRRMLYTSKAYCRIL